jgi:hypothetical protein
MHNAAKTTSRRPWGYRSGETRRWFLAAPRSQRAVQTSAPLLAHTGPRRGHECRHHQGAPASQNTRDPFHGTARVGPPTVRGCRPVRRCSRDPAPNELVGDGEVNAPVVWEGGVPKPPGRRTHRGRRPHSARAIGPGPAAPRRPTDRGARLPLAASKPGRPGSRG